jgi:putative effector of murein hydrolase
MNISGAGLLTPAKKASTATISACPFSLLQRAQCYIGLAILLILDFLLKFLFKSLQFPSPLIGMALIISSLVTAQRYDLHHGPQKFFAPAVDWVAHKWLPCFYAPALVTLPLSLAPLPPQSIVTAIVVIGVGVVVTCAFTSRIAIAIRTATGTEYQLPPQQNEQHHDSVSSSPNNKPHNHHHNHSRDTINIQSGNGSGGGGIHFSKFNYYSWGAAAGFSLLILILSPMEKTGIAPPATFLLLLSSTMLGYMGGMACPESVKMMVHPMLVTALVPNMVAAGVGLLTNQGYYTLLREYLTKGNPHNSQYTYLYGPGDVLFAFLGVIILSFGFKVFDEWQVLCQHRYEVLGTTFLSAGFSMLSTAALAGVAGLPQELARGVVPRGATLALALPIAERLGASGQLTAAAVALTGLIGCNFVQRLMTAFGATDPISRGLAAAATAHGLGTAAMAAREPEGLPFAALSYALCGVSASVLACIPLFKDALLWLTG